MKWHEKITLKHYIFAAVGIAGIFAFTLWMMGQPFMCKCGYVKFWHGVTFSSENSQHITDWYTFSHVIHGFGFYFLLWLVGKRWPLGLRLLAAMVLEASWEIFENTDLIINRYREVTISLDYFGDSIINSVGDLFFSVVGFFLAWRLPVWATILLILGMEAFVGYFIRDNLILNIIMLIYPLDSIREWQAGG